MYICKYSYLLKDNNCLGQVQPILNNCQTCLTCFTISLCESVLAARGVLSILNLEVNLTYAYLPETDTVGFTSQ